MTDFGFTRQARLINKSDFDRVFSKAKRDGNRFFTILSRENAGQSARLGLAVSKRVDKRAVKRNLIKRVIRESFRMSQATVHGEDFIVIPKPIAAKVSRGELRTSLDRLWRRIGDRSKH